MNLERKAFAKINLGLRILGKREDGYHELETIFQQISLHDELQFTTAAQGILIECTHPHCPVDEKNLAYQAAQLLL